MVLASESVVALSDGIPDLWGAALRLALAVGLIVAAATAWLYWQRRVRGCSRLLEVLDRTALTRGASVALVRVGERRLLLGVSTDGVRLIRDLEGGDPPSAFSEVLERAAGGREDRR